MVARGCGVPARTRVTQTSAGFSGAGGLPACERMNRRRTGVSTHCEHAGECAVYVRLRERRGEEGFSFLFLRIICEGCVRRGLAKVASNPGNKVYISSLFCPISDICNSTVKEKRRNIYLSNKLRN